MNLKLRAEILGKTEEEIRSEMASAIGRIGRTFEGLLAQLKKADPQHGEKYKELLDETRLYYWYFIVQRESIGLRNHDQLVRELDVPLEVRRWR